MSTFLFLSANIFHRYELKYFWVNKKVSFNELTGLYLQNLMKRIFQMIPDMVYPNSWQHENSKQADCLSFFHVADVQPVFPELTVCLAYLEH
jgi:hypothetical protein